MIMPGYSSARVPVNVRLFVAIAVTLALTPLLGGDVQTTFLAASPIALTKLMISEILIGALIGFMGRIFFAALETLGSAMATATGLSSPLGSPVEDSETLPSIASLIVLAATALIFITDLHWEVLRALVASYKAMPIGEGFGARYGLIQIADTFSKSFVLALRISSPFIIFSVLINFAIGLANKLTPQIPVYFIMTPFVVGAGLFLLYFSIKGMLDIFMSGFASWLATG